MHGQKAYGCTHLYWKFGGCFVKRPQKTSKLNHYGLWRGHDSAPRKAELSIGGCTKNNSSSNNMWMAKKQIADSWATPANQVSSDRMYSSYISTLES